MVARCTLGPSDHTVSPSARAKVADEVGCGSSVALNLQVLRLLPHPQGRHTYLLALLLGDRVRPAGCNPILKACNLLGTSPAIPVRTRPQPLSIRCGCVPLVVSDDLRHHLPFAQRVSMSKVALLARHWRRKLAASSAAWDVRLRASVAPPASKARRRRSGHGGGTRHCR